jgi:hypothetical protein
VLVKVLGYVAFWGALVAWFFVSDNPLINFAGTLVIFATAKWIVEYRKRKMQ